MSPLDVYKDLKRIHLHPGEILMAEEPTVVVSVLGSCVSTCLFDPITRRGAICHGALPNAPVTLHQNPFRYCDEAILYLLERFRRTGVPPSRLVVKVFGGADVLDTRPREGYASIGRQNETASLETLGWQRIRPAVVQTGGQMGRKLVFVTHTGETFVKRVERIVQ